MPDPEERAEETSGGEPTPRRPAREGRRRGPLLFLLAIYAAHVALLAADGDLRVSRMNIRGIDPVAYYAYFHSLYFDHDLDFKNQYALLGQGFIPPKPTPTGLTENHSSIGPALALAPFWIAADAVARIGHWTADGTSTPYHVAAFVGLGIYGLAALLLTGLWAMRRFGRWPGAIAAALAWGVGPLLYYSLPLTLMPHAIGAAAAALFLLAVDLTAPPSKRAGALGGAALGLAMLIRWQNALFGLYPLVFSIARIAQAKERRQTWGREFAYWALFAAAALAAFSPQMAAWQVLYGRPLLEPQEKGYLVLSRFHVLQLLFSTHNGLFVWTPGVALAVIGLALAKRTQRLAALGLALVLLAQIVINSSVIDWHGAWGFSGRRFTESTPIFAFGIAAWLVLAKRREWRLAVSLIGALFIVWNEMFVFQFMFHLIAWDQPLTAHEIVADKFHLDRSYRRRLMVDSARFHAEQGDLATAFRCLEIAESLDPGHDDIYETRAQLDEIVGDLPAAIQDYDQALEIRPGTKRLIEARAHDEELLKEQMEIQKRQGGKRNAQRSE